MDRLLLLDENLPRRLATELTARGRHARSLRGPASDSELIASLDADVVLVTTDGALPREFRRSGATLAIVHARDEATKRETVHHWAHRMAAQPAGSVRHYRRNRA
jgi:predicted nuclease of predicted toxin-antitoxin system